MKITATQLEISEELNATLAPAGDRGDGYDYELRITGLDRAGDFVAEETIMMKSSDEAAADAHLKSRGLSRIEDWFEHDGIYLCAALECVVI